MIEVMKKNIQFGVIAFLLATICISCTEKNPWKLVFADEFNDGKLDESVWHKIPRGQSDWNNYMSNDERCFDFRDGCLILRGIKNDNLEADTAQFLTGGVENSGLKPFPAPARYEIRARLHGCRGAWPAIWLLPYDGQTHPYPTGGEIDIMERLNSDSIAYQTVHSYYTLNLQHPNEPEHGGSNRIDPDDFNVYGVDIMPDSVVFHINGVHTLTYPRLPEKEEEKQFPFILEQYLMMDMQLGGQWVGKVFAEDLPVEMEIDWVHVYEYKP